MDEKMSPDRVLVEQLGKVAGLADRVWPLQPKKNAEPPFAFYVKVAGTEDYTLDGPAGLLHCGYKLHTVAGDYSALVSLGWLVKTAMDTMQGQRFGPEGSEKLLIERVQLKQASPDLYETEVGLYRRIYDLTIDYQYEGSEEG